MDTRQTTSEEDDLETSSDGSSSQNSASNQSASVAPVIRQSDPDIVISKNVSSSGSAAGASRSGDGHQILISSSSSINVRAGEKGAEEGAVRSVLQKGAPPSGVASKSEVLLRPPPRLKKLAKMRQAEQMHRTRNEAKNFQPVLQYPQ